MPCACDLYGAWVQKEKKINDAGIRNYDYKTTVRQRQDYRKNLKRSTISRSFISGAAYSGCLLPPVRCDHDVHDVAPRPDLRESGLRTPLATRLVQPHLLLRLLFVCLFISSKLSRNSAPALHCSPRPQESHSSGPPRRLRRGSRESWSHCTWSASTRSVPSNPNSADPAVVADKAASTQPCSPPVPPTAHCYCVCRGNSAPEPEFIGGTKKRFFTRMAYRRIK
jgi:hypothetical protein